MKSTDCVHAGKIFDTSTKGMVTPVYPSTSFDYIDTDILAYPRYFNTPNQKAVVKKLCALEHGGDGLVTSSGMSAITTVLFALLQNGDHAVFEKNLYGGTYHAVVNEMERYGISYSFSDASEDSIRSATKDNTKLIYFETPSNPLINITDIRMVARVAKEKGVVTVIDNTFASPINQNPLDMGIDVVIHSGTKYLGGHSDIICGAIISNKALVEKFWNTAIHFGGSINAQTCYLLERSLKTLAIRVEKQNQNAMELSEYLVNHPLIKRVNYPGLTSHNGHKIAKNQMNGFGGMLSFEVDLLADETDRFLKKLKVIHSAISLGGVETIISSPSRTSHAKMTPQQRNEVGISDQLLRLSVGIEDVEDLKKDINQALGAALQSA
ncbi:MAG: aminotransferase class I/II-fold pyridoxal phosphate-dependent enzyme [Bacteroidetes bacterium]|nr:aminotransferase class I/II-fold pyridoxal phosphate-dependent enzyme [Bacteroidota bacterium]MCH8231867.1 aminotransferase class I/II-fold pyridoxal phosphate-dependent enzyme [Bacteroidota bacterium]